MADANISLATGVEERTSVPSFLTSVTGQTNPRGGGGGLANRFLNADLRLDAIFSIMGKAPGA